MPVPGPCEFLVLHHVVTRPAVCVHLQGPLSACRHPWEQVSSCRVPSHRSPQTHQAPMCCEFSHFPDVVEHGAEGKVGSGQHRASRLPDPILHPLFLTLHIPLAGSMHLPWCPAGMFQPHSGPRDFCPNSGFLKHFLNKERESASYSSLLRKSFIFLIIPLLF